MLVTMLVDRVGMSSVGLWAHAAFVTWGCHNRCAVSYWAALYERAIYSILYRGEQVSGMNEANSDPGCILLIPNHAPASTLGSRPSAFRASGSRVSRETQT